MPSAPAAERVAEVRDSEINMPLVKIGTEWVKFELAKTDGAHPFGYMYLPMAEYIAKGEPQSYPLTEAWE